MAELTDKSRLSSPLMYAFRAAHEAKDSAKKRDSRSDAGERLLAGRRARGRQVITEDRLRQEVSRDLDALLNSVALESSVDLTELPQVRKSILNFGIPDIAHRTIDEAGVNHIPGEIRAAIINYEPRLAKASLIIERDSAVDSAELKMRFVVHADLICDAVNIPVQFVADVIDTGKIVVTRL